MYTSSYCKSRKRTKLVIIFGEFEPGKSELRFRVNHICQANQDLKKKYDAWLTLPEPVQTWSDICMKSNACCWEDLGWRHNILVHVSRQLREQISQVSVSRNMSLALEYLSQKPQVNRTPPFSMRIHRQSQLINHIKYFGWIKTHFILCWIDESRVIWPVHFLGVKNLFKTTRE